MDVRKLEEKIKELGYPLYRANQIKDWVLKGKTFCISDITVLPQDIRTKLNNYNLLSLKLLKTFQSSDKSSFKFAFELKDFYVIETSLFKNSKNEWVVCVSSQVGCPVRCVFCASGRKGLKRNLNFEEIFDQVLFSRHFLVSNKLGDVKKIVYMGMGEPLLNYENVSESIKMINEDLKIGKRNISLSSFGYVCGIRRFAKDYPQVNFALSLHSASEEIRRKLIPFASKYPLSQLSKAIADYINITSNKVFIEYIMIDGVNCRISDAYRLRDFLKEIAPFRYFTVNLIPYNSVSSRFKSPDMDIILKFQNLILSLGIETTIRKSYARDINGACGQLAFDMVRGRTE